MQAYDNEREKIDGTRPNGTKNGIPLKIKRTINKVVKGNKKHIGVYLKPSGNYSARLKSIYLGTFSTKEEAARAYNIAAYEHYGENAVLNDIPDPLGKGEDDAPF